MDRVIFDSTSSVKGIIFQFLIALERCFEMQEGQTVYIERFGDVSVIDGEDSKQIESKYYKRYLTDLDENVWNTLSNWMDSTFPLDNFSSLVLLTTQRIGPKSKWSEWNTKNIVERKSILEEIYSGFEKKRKKSAKLKDIMNTIFDSKNHSRLESIAKKLTLDTPILDNVGYYNKLRDVYGGHLPKIQRGRYIHGLYGYIINPHIIENNWEIIYDDFSKERSELSKTLQDSTTVFPNKINMNEIDTNDYTDSQFVLKIKDIQYDEVLPEAVSDYVYAGQMIVEEINNSPTIRTSFETYEENLERIYWAKYRSACRKCGNNEIINRSQDLYDNITSSNDGTFHTYINIPLPFHNGVMHILSEEKKDIVWRLKVKDNE